MKLLKLNHRSDFGKLAEKVPLLPQVRYDSLMALSFAQSFTARIGMVVFLSATTGIVVNFTQKTPLSFAEPIYSKAEQTKTCASSPNSTLIWNQISAQEAIDLCNKNPYLVIGDLRTSLEFSQGHIPKATHLPCHGDKGQNFLSQLAPSTVLLLYDADGTSMQLQSALEAATSYGLKEIYIIQGGFRAWEEHQSIESGLCVHCNL